VRSKLLVDTEPEKSWVIVFDTDEEAMAGLLAFARAQSISAAHFTAIGAFSRAVLGYFDWQTKQYCRIPVDEQVEVVTLIGDIALEADKPKLHAHAALAKRGGVTVGGHLLEGHVRPTLEVMLSEAPKYLERRFDESSGIALIRI
jgi:predicted DNA-binding protein with PD1-like motif